jgi:hypothetical protein
MGRFGDLPFRVKSDLILIVQPQNFVGRTKESFLYSSDPSLTLKQISYGKMIEVVQKLLNLENLNHVTALHCSSDDGGKPIHYGPDCGGELIFSQGGKSETGFYDGRFVKIQCSRCNMYLETEESLEKLSNTVFHLAIKQMFPDLETLNLVYCASFGPNDQLSMRNEDYWQQVKNLGVISVASDIFHGHINDGYHDGNWDRSFSLGFMAIAGLNTLLGFDSMDRWAKVLIDMKFKQIEKFQKSHFSFLIGPKPSTKS